jgi:hypothetical protein
MTDTLVTPNPVLPDPTAAQALAHLAGEHGWDPSTPVDSPAAAVTAHSFAHGGGGRPDLADVELTHSHPGGPPTKPTSGLKRVYLVFVGVVAVGAIVTIASLSGGAKGSGTAAAAPAEVTYQLSGSARTADITYMDSAGQIQQQTGIDVPLTRKSDGGDGLIIHPAHGAFVSISAQNGGDSGDLGCQILYNGAVIRTGHSSGGYAITDCSVTVP